MCSAIVRTRVFLAVRIVQSASTIRINVGNFPEENVCENYPFNWFRVLNTRNASLTQLNSIFDKLGNTFVRFRFPHKSCITVTFQTILFRNHIRHGSQTLKHHPSVHIITPVVWIDFYVQFFFFSSLTFRVNWCHVNSSSKCRLGKNLFNLQKIKFNKYLWFNDFVLLNINMRME